MSGAQDRVTQGGYGTPTSRLPGWMLSHECGVLEATAGIPPPPHDVEERRNTTLPFTSFLKSPLDGFSPSSLPPTCAQEDDLLTLLRQLGFPVMPRTSSRAGKNHWDFAPSLSCSCFVELKYFLLEGLEGLGAGSSKLQVHKAVNHAWLPWRSCLQAGPGAHKESLTLEWAFQ